MSTPCKCIAADPILAFLCFGSTFLYFIHLLHVFCIKRFTPSEIFFRMMNAYAYRPDVIYFSHSSISMKRWLINNFHVLRFDIYVVPTLTLELMLPTPFYQNRLNHGSEFCLVNILTFSTCCVTAIF